MTEYLNEVINPEKPWLWISDTEENILDSLQRYTLDPIFEFYGNFINPSPKWKKEELAIRYAGCTVISGNFLNYSHAFRLVTNDVDLISRMTDAIEKNKRSPEYQAACKELFTNLPGLTKENARVGAFYSFGGECFQLTRLYRLTEQEANQKALLYLDRYEGITRDGHTIGGAIPGSSTISSSKNWIL